MNSYLDHDAGEDETEDDEYERDEEPWLGLELVTNDTIEDQESHIWHHAEEERIDSRRSRKYRQAPT